jgi:poly(hydroxyalkanoate) depolymerase family esterase
MKSRLLVAMSDALSLVKKSNLAEATTLLRNALAGGAARPGEGEAADAPDARRTSMSLPARRPLGDVLNGLRLGRSLYPNIAETPRPMPPELLDEKFASRNHSGAAGSLNYRLYAPADHARRELALVVMLHGCTQNPEDFAIGTRMNQLADEFGLIVAYPLQPRTANASGCWNWFDRRHQKRGLGEPAMLAGLALALGAEFGIARGRTFVAGLSAGGAMAEILGATYADVFDAVAVHSGLPYGAASDLPSAFAAMKGTAIGEPAPRKASEIASKIECRRIVFHGGADATVHPANATRILDQARRGAIPPKQIDLDWEIDGGRVNRTVLHDSEDRPIFEHWIVEGGGHAWFGGDARGSYTQSVGLDASRVMVRFFLKQ